MSQRAPTDNGEATLCMEILQEQSDCISRTNKLFVSSPKPAFQEKCIETIFLLQPNVYEIQFYNYLATRKLYLFTSISVNFDRKCPLNK